MATTNILAPVDKQVKGLKKIEALVDSGAFDHVAPEGYITNYELKAGKSKGATYTVGSGHEIVNVGEQTTKVRAEEGDAWKVTWQITSVNRAILSVPRLTEEGCDVRFWKHKKGGKIMRPTGEVMKFRSKHGVYVLDLWVMDNPHGNSPPKKIQQGPPNARAAKSAAGFQRQGT